MKLDVNGQAVELSSGPLTSLLDALRDELNVTSAKAGCRAGGCGACTVLVDGTPKRSCMIPIAAVDGADITTVEGLGTAHDPTPVQQSFIHHYAAQCGFCTPGMVVAATAYLADGGSGDKAEVAEAISGHVCRCTGYSKILDAISAAASASEFDTSTTASDPSTVVVTGGES